MWTTYTLLKLFAFLILLFAQEIAVSDNTSVIIFLCGKNPWKFDTINPEIL